MPNPVLGRFDASANGRQPGSGPAGYPPNMTPAQLDAMYAKPAYTPERYMTLDDVVVRTAAMLAVVFGVGALTWALGPTSTSAGGLIGVGAIGGLALGLYMAFTMKANAVLAMAYSAFEGLLLGGVSRAFEARYPGVVVQALTGTFMVAAGMLFVYKTGAIRVTPRLTRIVVGATIGVVGLMIVNLLASIFVSGGLGLRAGGPIAILFSLLCIGLAAFNLVLDFDLIENGIRRGVDQKFAWFASFGLVVTLVWLYFEILRLLGYARN